MKIAQLETLRLESRPSVIWVRLHTDQGLIGLGETWFGVGAVEADLHERIAPLLLGEDAGAIERLAAQAAALRRLRRHRGGAARALGGRRGALGPGRPGRRPADPRLLGGALRAAIPVYNTCAGPDYVSKTADVRPGNFGLPGEAGRGRSTRTWTPSCTGRRARRRAAGDGHRVDEDLALRLRRGRGRRAGHLGRRPEAALAPFEKVRKAHGDTMRLKAELHGLWSLPAAQEDRAALEPLEPDWIEDPVWMDRPSEIAAGRRDHAPLAGGETLGGLGQFRELIAGGGVAVPIMDVTWGGGITVARKVAALAEAAGLPVAFHDCSGPVTLAASTHLALACPNVARAGDHPGLLLRLVRRLRRPATAAQQGDDPCARRPWPGNEAAGRRSEAERREGADQSALDQTALNWNQLSADNLIYFIRIEQLIPSGFDNDSFERVCLIARQARFAQRCRCTVSGAQRSGRSRKPGLRWCAAARRVRCDP